MFFQLNYTSKNIFLAINKTSDFCENKSSCIDTELNKNIDKYLDKLIDDTQDYVEFNEPYSKFQNVIDISLIFCLETNLCNIERDDCSFKNQKCEIGLFLQSRCVCQNGYYQYNNINNDCISKLIFFCNQYF